MKERYCEHCGREIGDEEETYTAESDFAEVCGECYDEDEEIENMFFG